MDTGSRRSAASSSAAECALGSGFLDGGKVTGRYQGPIWDATMPAKPTIARPWPHGDPDTGPFSDDHREALSAMRDKRAPLFTGR